MKRYLLLLMLLVLALPVQAQTATPTISPYVLYEGEYNIVALRTGQRSTESGVWSPVFGGGQSALQTTSTTAWIAFTVSDTVCTVSVAHQVGSSTQNIGVQINGGTTFVFQGQTPAVGNHVAKVETDDQTTDFTVKLALSGAGTLTIYSIQLLSCPPNPVTPYPTATAISSSTPAPTWTLAPSHTPPNTPVPTATILPSSTPAPTWTLAPSHTPPNTPVPTATILPSSTPAPTWTLAPSHTPPNTPVPTATILPSSTPGGPTPTQINTPVDTPTALNVDPLLTLIAGLTPVTLTPSGTPTVTNTPTATFTPTPEPHTCLTMVPVDPTATPAGQLACFEYSATASDVYLAVLLALLLFSIWGFFLVYVLVLRRQR
jgi:hypothetical protein